MEDEQLTMTCPQCGAELEDYDGFGVVAHTRPAYADGCGYCTHPSRDDGVCGICGDVERVGSHRDRVRRMDERTQNND